MVSQLAGSATRQSGSPEGRANAKWPLLCPVCRERVALLRYSKKDTPYVVCPCGVRIFVWSTGVEGLILKRVQDYSRAKTQRKFEEYKKSQMEGR